MRSTLVAILLLMGASSGCSSSLRMVRQSDVYFERCYAADFDPSASRMTRQRCWARWLNGYTEGQPPDRIRYARLRLETIKEGELLEPLPSMGSPSIEARSTTTFLSVEGTSEPEQTSPPREPVAPKPSGEVSDEPIDQAPAGLPEDSVGAGTGCGAGLCSRRWEACVSRCKGRAYGCTRACRTERSTCEHACY